MPPLGGLRHARRDSINTAWRNASFRGYADYMQTPEFDAALGELIRVARGRRTAIMCAEAVPWRCHRSLIADALDVRGLVVDEITGANSTRPHTLTPWASVVGQHITYPATQHDDTNLMKGMQEEKHFVWEGNRDDSPNCEVGSRLFRHRDSEWRCSHDGRRNANSHYAATRR